MIAVRFLSPCLPVFVSLLLMTGAEAAPPSATLLSPAGGQRGTSVTVTVSGTFDTWPIPVWSSHTGVTVEAAKTKGKLTVKIAPDAEPGVAWLRLYDKQGASAAKPFVVGTLLEIEEKEPNDAVEKAQIVDAPGGVINGLLAKPGDVDCYAVKLKKDQTLTASLLANETLAAPMDAVLQILDARGFVLEQSNDVHGLDPHAVFTSPAEGTYVVRLFAFPSKPDSNIRHMGAETCIYRLTLATQGYIDHAWPLAVSRATPGDVELIGTNLPETARRIPVPATTEDSASLWRPDLAGMASVSLEPHPCFRIADLKDQAPPFTVSGRLEKPGQVASLPFRGTKGKPLVIQVEAETLGSLLTPQLRVLDAEGKQLARAEANIGQDAELSFTPPMDGLYRLEVNDVYRAGGNRYWFRARLAPPMPDFSLSMAIDRLEITPDKPADVTVTVLRRQGFKGEIELVAENLPAGVKATSVKAAKPDGKTLVLRITAEKGGMGGPIRIVGKATGAKPRAVVPTLVEIGSVPVDLWLTVRAAK